MTKDKDYYNELFFGAKVTTFDNANYLRKNETKAEKILWIELRNRKLGGFKFRRQHPLEALVADFYCSEKKLIVELDGDVHIELDKREYDKARTEFLKIHEINVLRFKNDEIYNDLDSVLRKILEVLNS